MNIPFNCLSDSYVEYHDEALCKIAELAAKSQFILGEEVEAFESEYAEYCNCRYCVACANGTDAISLSLKTLGVGENDVVLVPANTFIATAEGAINVGAKVDFVDVDESTFNIDVEEFERKICEGKGIKAIIPVHLYGQMARMPQIMAIARRKGILVVEDASQAHGALYNGQGPGSYGDIATFSFYPGKNLGAFGDAGAIVTNSQEAYQIGKKLVNHGREKAKYEHEILGYNMRMDSIQAAVLRIKLRHLKDWNKKRSEKKALYEMKLKEVKDIMLPHVDPHAQHVWHIFSIRVGQRDRVRELLSDQGIQTGIHYPKPLHLQKAFSYLNHQVGDFPIAEKIAHSVLSLPFWPEIKEEEIENVCECLTRTLAGLKNMASAC